MKNEKIVQCNKCRRRVPEGQRDPYTFRCPRCEDERDQLEALWLDEAFPNDGRIIYW
jgi:hypothetical protein